MSYDLDDVIEHYGVKGMKWGVRKDPDRVSARKQSNKAENVKKYVGNTASSLKTRAKAIKESEKAENVKKYVGNTASSLKTRAKEQKSRVQMKRADKKWEKGITQKKLDEAMKESDRRTKEQQAKAFNKISKSDTYKKAQSGDPFAKMQLDFEWTAEYATILNADFAKQAELKSPSGKKAIEITLTQIGGKPLMAPKVVDKK